MIRARYWLLTALLSLPHVVQAQAGGAEVADSPVSSAVVTPEWLVWRAFHGSMAFYMRDSPNDVYALLKERANLTDSDISVVLDAGDQYLHELSVVDDNAKRDVEARRKTLGRPEDILRAHGQGPAASTDAKGVVRIDVGQVLRDGLIADGIGARVNQEREGAYRTHRQRLIGALGQSKLATLDSLVETVVSPNVQVFPQPTIDGPRHSLEAFLNNQL